MWFDWSLGFGKWWKARSGLKLNVLLRVCGSFNSVKTCQDLWTMFSWSVWHAFSFVKQLDDNSCLTEVAGWWFGWKMHYKLLLRNHYWYYGLLCSPPHHILVSVGQVYGGGGVFYVRQLVADRVLLDAGVVHGPGPLPRHQQAAEVVRSRLDVLWLRTADWQRDTDENIFKKGLGNILPKYIFFVPILRVTADGKKKFYLKTCLDKVRIWFHFVKTGIY